MLRQVLRMAVERSCLRSEEVARALDVSAELVQLMLAELVRRDYLEIAVAGDSTACERCPLRVTCPHRRPPQIWRLGRKAAARAAA
jgi:hypothetical protein